MISKSEKMIKSTKQKKKKLKSRLKNTQSKTLIIFLNLCRFCFYFFSPECNYENKKIGIIPNMCRLHKY